MPSPDVPVRPEPSFDEARSIQEYWEQHYHELLKQYPEQFVAVRNDKVVAANEDLAMLVYALRDKGIDARTDVAIQFISADSASLLL